MLRQSIVAVLVAGLACGTALAYNPPLTGDVQAGTLYYTGDLSIYNVRIIPGPQGERTLTIKVTNGTITVGNGSLNSPGIDGSGKDGEHGVPGGPPSAGEAAGASFNLVLETWPDITGIESSPCDIEVAAPINLSGGDGGNGASGNAGRFDVKCNHFGAFSGSTGQPGTDGGSLILRSSGNITISRAVEVYGGRGGWGGSGGEGLLGAAGQARPGRNGGKGGSILLEHTMYAPATATCGVVSQGDTHGLLSANGGDAGDGGAGAMGFGGPSSGANGGSGGAGGSIVVSARSFIMVASNPGGTSGGTQGGSGGVGGNGAPGSAAGCVWCDAVPGTKWNQPGSAGSNSGSGGAGGAGGPITITTTYDIALSTLYTKLITSGGRGQVAGRAGGGGLGGLACDPTPCASTIPFSAGSSFGSGKGGKAGVITLAGRAISLAWSHQFPDQSAMLVAEGGDGAAGLPAANAGTVCCNDVRRAAGGAQGGAAGAGGNGGDIKFHYTQGLSAQSSQLKVCGGSGAAGGKGGMGIPVGVGGIGTDDGVPGTIYKNNVPTSSGCTVLHYPDGAVGDGYPDCGGIGG